jgi:hypothetical protein
MSCYTAFDEVGQPSLWPTVALPHRDCGEPARISGHPRMFGRKAIRRSQPARSPLRSRESLTNGWPVVENETVSSGVA